MLLSLIFLPFINFILIFQFGRFFSIFGSFIIILIFNLLKICFILFFFYKIILYNLVQFYNIESFKFFFLNYINLSFSFYFDFLTLSMLFLISFISFFVQCYSYSYMRFDPQLLRFLSFLNLFTFCMYLLISSGNLVQFFFGQECVGLCSYLLINFQFTRINANKSAIKAMLVNKIGDRALLISLCLIFLYYRTFDFLISSQLIYLYKFVIINFFNINFNYLYLICFFF